MKNKKIFASCVTLMFTCVLVLTSCSNKKSEQVTKPVQLVEQEKTTTQKVNTPQLVGQDTEQSTQAVPKFVFKAYLGGKDTPQIDPSLFKISRQELQNKLREYLAARLEHNAADGWQSTEAVKEFLTQDYKPQGEPLMVEVISSFEVPDDSSISVEINEVEKTNSSSQRLYADISYLIHTVGFIDTDSGEYIKKDLGIMKLSASLIVDKGNVMIGMDNSFSDTSRFVLILDKDVDRFLKNYPIACQKLLPWQCRNKEEFQKQRISRQVLIETARKFLAVSMQADLMLGWRAEDSYDAIKDFINDRYETFGGVKTVILLKRIDVPDDTLISYTLLHADPNYSSDTRVEYTLHYTVDVLGQIEPSTGKIVKKANEIDYLTTDYLKLDFLADEGRVVLGNGLQAPPVIFVLEKDLPTFQENYKKNCNARPVQCNPDP